MLKVSIVIPIYNVENYIEDCLKSTINQTLKDIEIICVNDCSTDNSLEIIQKFAQQDNRIKIINKDKNEGAGITRNIGQQNASGKYIMFLDPDDYISLDCCEKLYNKIETDNVDAVYFNAFRFKNKSKKMEEYKELNLLSNKDGSFSPFYAKDKYNILINYTKEVWFKFYNRQFLINNNIKCSEHRLCEDYLFNLQFLLSNPKLSVLDEHLYYYRLSQNSLTKQSTSKLNYILDVHNQYTDKILNSHLSKEEQLLFINNQLALLIWWTNQKVYDKKNLINNKKIRRQYYEKILKHFSFDDIINANFNEAFWKDFTGIGNKLLGLYIMFVNGKAQYRITFPYGHKCFNKQKPSVK